MKVPRNEKTGRWAEADLIERWTEKVAEPFDVHNDCWMWTGSKTGSGYGQIWVNRRMVTAHRVSHELFIGPIPDGHAVDHLCGNRLCVRPDHLQALDHYTNWSQWNLGKTHCINGHPYSGDNLRFKPSGERRCRICHNAQARERWKRISSLKPPRQERTHCVNGHEFSDVNTYRRPDGSRECRVCSRASKSNYRHRKVG